MIRNQRTVVALAFLALSLAAGCSKKEEGKAGAGAQATTAVDLAGAREIFTSRCAACHGADGRGDGAASAALNPKPRNYHDSAWQKSVTDDQIKQTILMGGAAVGKSPVMPSSPDLDSKPEVVDGLVRLVREFGKS